MSPRSIRRAAERKQRKLERKQERLTAHAAPATTPPVGFVPQNTEADEAALRSELKTQENAEFSPEFIAQARAVRDRIARRPAIDRVRRPHSTAFSMI